MRLSSFQIAVCVSVGLAVSVQTAAAQLIFEGDEPAVEKKVIDDNALPWLKQEETVVEPEKVVPPTRKKVDVKVIEDEEAALVASVNFPLRFLELQDSHKEVLDLKLRGVEDKKEARLQLRSFATAKVGHAGEERRIALKRALSMRDYLVEMGFNKKYVYIQALGKEGASDGARDRIDILRLN